MKKIYFLGLALAGLLTANAQVIIQDDFESYPLGPYFGEHWSTWSGSSGAENIIISSDQANSGTKSGYIGDGGVQDAVWQFGDEYASGTYTIQWKMYIDFGAGAYTNIQEKTIIGAAGNFANVLQFGTNAAEEVTPGMASWTGIRSSDGANVYVTFPFTEETWFDVKMVVNLDASPKTAQLFIDGEEILTEFGPLGYNGDFGTLAGIDFYSYTADGGIINSFYIDDVVFAQGTLGVNDAQSVSTISVYPTVANDVINVSAKSNISEVTVFNTAGQQVAKVAGNGTSVQVNVSALPAGVYVVKTVAGKEIKTTKVVVK